MGWSILTGSELHMLDPREHGPGRLAEWLRERRITALNATPSLLRALTAVLEDGTVLEDLRLVSSGGEAIHGRDVLALREHLPPHCTFVNRTGSSEAGTLAEFPIRPGDDVPDGPIPSGWPLADMELVIEREDGTRAAPGEVGEIVAASAYMSAGYWNDPELTSVRFGRRDDGVPLLRTHDLGRMGDDGCLEYLGRRDTTVKVRGYLVEPAEVEAALLATGAVAETVVVGEDDPRGGKRLAAFVVAAPGAAPTAAALRDAVQERLSSFMVPQRIELVAALPRTERGKVDRSRLDEAVRTAGTATSGPAVVWVLDDAATSAEWVLERLSGDGEWTLEVAPPDDDFVAGLGRARMAIVGAGDPAAVQEAVGRARRAGLDVVRAARLGSGDATAPRPAGGGAMARLAGLVRRRPVGADDGPTVYPADDGGVARLVEDLRRMLRS